MLILTQLPLGLAACCIKTWPIPLSPTADPHILDSNLVGMLISFVFSCLAFTFVMIKLQRQLAQTEVKILSVGRINLQLPPSLSAFHLHFERTSNCFTQPGGRTQQPS